MPPIPTDLPCLRCGYNLRTLSPTASCPECNLPITDSQTYAAAHPSTLRRPTRLLLACLLLIANELTYFITLFAALLLNLFHTAIPNETFEILSATNPTLQALLLPPITFLLWTSGPTPTPAARIRRYLWLPTAPLYALLLLLTAAFSLYQASLPSPVMRFMELSSFLTAAHRFLFLFILLAAWLHFSNIARLQRKPFLRHLTTTLAAAGFLYSLLALLLSLRSALTPLATSLPVIGLVSAAVLHFITHLTAALLLFPLFAHLAWKARASAPQSPFVLSASPND
ncbi:MAG TPA: hypothetical protein VH253_13160 [Phycisphaerae bacterium]|nr:hypothetical protein [Phycisphaerae bacterium]